MPSLTRVSGIRIKQMLCLMTRFRGQSQKIGHLTSGKKLTIMIDNILEVGLEEDSAVILRGDLHKSLQAEEASEGLIMMEVSVAIPVGGEATEDSISRWAGTTNGTAEARTSREISMTKEMEGIHPEDVGNPMEA